MALQPDGKLVAAGGFTAFNDIDRWRVARIHGDSPARGARVIGAERLPNGRFRASINGEPGRLYTIQASADLREWLDVDHLTAEAAVFEFVDSNMPLKPRRFYRVKAEP